MTEQQLDKEELVELVDSTVSEMKSSLEEQTVPVKSLEELLEAEKNSKDRKTAVSFLENKIEQEKINQKIRVAERDVEEIEGILDEIEETRDARKIAEPEELEAADLISIVGGTVKQLKQKVQEKNLGEKQLEELLEAEKAVKDRKTAVSFLEKEIEDAEFEKDLEAAEDDIKHLKEEIQAMEKEEQKQSTGRRSQLQSSMKDRTSGKDEDSTGENEETGTAETSEEGSGAPEKEEPGDKDNRGTPNGPRASEDPDKKPVEPGTEEEVEEELGPEFTGEEAKEVEPRSPRKPVEEEPESAAGEQLPEKETEDGEEADSEEPEEPEEEEDGDEDDDEEESELEQKKDILEELDVELSDEELEEISLDDLESMRMEKKRRERLISKLSQEFDEEMLRQSSTRDLKKLNQETDIETEDQEKKDKDIREEAAEDLKMLKGAVKKDEEENEEEEESESGLEKAKSKLRGLVGRNQDDGEEEDEGVNDDKILSLLDEYQDLEPREAAIKTAHVMKGYLESKEDIAREMTYKELAEEIDSDSGEMEKLLDFFKRMHIDQYTGNIKTEDIDEIIESSKQVVQNLR